jgi:hypothetical protein
VLDVDNYEPECARGGIQSLDNKKKIHWKSFVQSQLLLVQRADDGTDQIDARASNGQVLESSFGNVLSLPRVSQNLS